MDIFLKLLKKILKCLNDESFSPYSSKNLQTQTSLKYAYT